jgi:hypothetical protein
MVKSFGTDEFERALHGDTAAERWRWQIWLALVGPLSRRPLNSPENVPSSIPANAPSCAADLAANASKPKPRAVHIGAIAPEFHRLAIRNDAPDTNPRGSEVNRPADRALSLAEASNLHDATLATSFFMRIP